MPVQFPAATVTLCVLIQLVASHNCMCFYLNRHQASPSHSVFAQLLFFLKPRTSR